MMNVQTFSMIWDHLRQMNGIALRLVDALPADKLDAHPIANMRTPKELVVHVYGYVRTIPEGIAGGELKEADEKSALASIKTKADLVRYCTDCWEAGTAAGARLTDAQLAAMVKTPWGGAIMPGHALVQVVRDELTHHRGQLYAYVRALGGEVPMMWDFEHNAPEYQPKAHAGA
jgi:uncharacterized damage-inducible protein DinB